MESCYFCHNPQAHIICPGCHVARYCSATCQDKCERIFKHSTNLCLLQRPSSSSSLLPIQQTSSLLLLGVRIEHDGVTLATADHIPVYQWFKEYILEKGQVSPMMDPLPIDDWDARGRQRVPNKRTQWLLDRQTNAERYAKTVIDLAHTFHFEFAHDDEYNEIDISAAEFFELVANKREKKCLVPMAVRGDLKKSMALVSVIRA